MRVKGRRQKREDGDGGAENDPHEVAGAREALQCAVKAVAFAAEANENQESDVRAVYAEQRWCFPLERAMAAANAYSLGHKTPVAAPGDGDNAAVDAEIAELTRLIASVDPGKHHSTRERLEKQKARKKEVTSKVKRSGGCPPQLQVAAQTVEDPLEARRDSQGRAVPLGRNVLGEQYASYSSPLRYTRGKTAAEIFVRMKRAIREDIQTRDAHRIAALNQQDRAKKQQLKEMGYISPEAVIEARFDYLMRRESTDPAS